MTAEIKTIFGGRRPGEPSTQLIEELELLLAEARRGELIGIAYASARESGEPGNPITGTGWVGEAGTRHALGSTIGMLQHRYTAALLEPRE